MLLTSIVLVQNALIIKEMLTDAAQRRAGALLTNARTTLYIANLLPKYIAKTLPAIRRPL
jgi:hypothetical protein